MLAVGILGTTISPYMFFWQSNQEVEEEIAAGRRTLAQRRGATRAELKYAAIDVNLGMLMSNIVMYFIILSTAATLFRAGKTDIQSAADAAGSPAAIRWPRGGSFPGPGTDRHGLPGGAHPDRLSAYAVAEMLGWKHGLDKRPKGAKKFYWLILGSTLAGMLINFGGINPIKALFLRP